MLKRVISLVLAAVILLSFTAAAYAAAGGAEDPLISLTYLNTYISNLLTLGGSKISEAFGKFDAKINKKLDDINAVVSGNTEFASGYKMLYLKTGGTVSITTGGSVNLISGTMRITDVNGTAINVSDGKTVDEGKLISANNRYFAAEKSKIVLTAYDSAIVTVNGPYSSTESGAAPRDISFSDVPGFWAEDYINYLAINGIVNGMGEGRFEPSYTMTRAMFVTIIGRLSKVNTASYTTTQFNDVDVGAWYGPYVAWASQNGIVNGYGDGTFLPNASISREQMAVIIMRYAQFCGVNLQNKNPQAVFSDDSLFSAWAKDSVYGAQRTGLINGRPDNTFDPKGTATRAEVCTVIYRYIKSSENT